MEDIVKKQAKIVASFEDRLEGVIGESRLTTVELGLLKDVVKKLGVEGSEAARKIAKLELDGDKIRESMVSFKHRMGENLSAMGARMDRAEEERSDGQRELKDTVSDVGLGLG